MMKLIVGDMGCTTPSVELGSTLGKLCCHKAQRCVEVGLGAQRCVEVGGGL
jgi:hypothetical protein